MKFDVKILHHHVKNWFETYNEKSFHYVIDWFRKLQINVKCEKNETIVDDVKISYFIVKRDNDRKIISVHDIDFFDVAIDDVNVDKIENFIDVVDDELNDEIIDSIVTKNEIDFFSITNFLRFLLCFVRTCSCNLMLKMSTK